MRCAECRVVAVKDCGKEYYQLIVEKPLDMNFAPGQFVHVIDQDSPDLLRRPFSVASQTEELFTLLIKEVGSMSRRLRFLRPGENLNVLGPLGNSFDISKKEKAIVIGGGVGIAPLLRLTQDFERVGREYIALLGFRDEAEAAALFQSENVRVHIESRDAGMVTDLLGDHLQEKVEVFACGPLPMLKKVRSMCAERQIRVQLSLEERMACGVGACIGCAVAIRGEAGVEYKRVCVDGPVFQGEELAWE